MESPSLNGEPLQFSGGLDVSLSRSSSDQHENDSASSVSESTSTSSAPSVISSDIRAAGPVGAALLKSPALPCLGNDDKLTVGQVPAILCSVDDTSDIKQVHPGVSMPIHIPTPSRITTGFEGPMSCPSALPTGQKSKGLTNETQHLGKSLEQTQPDIHLGVSPEKSFVGSLLSQRISGMASGQEKMQPSQGHKSPSIVKRKFQKESPTRGSQKATSSQDSPMSQKSFASMTSQSSNSTSSHQVQTQVSNEGNSSTSPTKTLKKKKVPTATLR